ncbi:hypothetical protein PIPA1_29240 [Pelosinus sp. IPA-1]|nr:hypothetical protein PIPA1_29240 [Pelosinus sp. IPA-1]
MARKFINVLTVTDNVSIITYIIIKTYSLKEDKCKTTVKNNRNISVGLKKRTTCEEAVFRCPDASPYEHLREAYKEVR